jgi:hypothetical protein
MKNLLSLFSISLLIFSCNLNKTETNNNSVITANGEIPAMAEKIYRGDSVDLSAAITVEDLMKQMDGKTRLENITLIARVESCCQKKGCWMKVDKGNGETMMVTFKDYGFFVPFESAGKNVFMKGFAFMDTISVDMLKHYAEDAGKTKDEINAITEPEIALAFEASGLVLQ